MSSWLLVLPLTTPVMYIKSSELAVPFFSYKVAKALHPLICILCLSVPVPQTWHHPHVRIMRDGTHPIKCRHVMQVSTFDLVTPGSLYNRRKGKGSLGTHKVDDSAYELFLQSASVG